ncbi:hypothetical protein APTSU1_001637800 [Apodemus speciosus]|uniref:Uncharacterized protein n=1 Tax=Apodemus speciosus TaxID=105296 RepID=A0ABQ0FPF5_APOSI
MGTKAPGPEGGEGGRHRSKATLKESPAVLILKQAEDPGLFFPPAQQHVSSMTGQLQEKPPEPGPRRSRPLPRSRV